MAVAHDASKHALAMDSSYEIRGCVNNAPIQVVERARSTAGASWSSKASKRQRIRWDAALGALSVAEIALSVTAAGSPEPGLQESLHSWIMLHDESGRVAGHAIVSGTMVHEAEELRLRLQVLDATLRLEAGEQLRELGAPSSSVIAAGPRHVLTTAWSVSSDHSNAYRGVTTVVCDTLLEDEPLSQVVSVVSASTTDQREGPSSG